MNSFRLSESKFSLRVVVVNNHQEVKECNHNISKIGYGYDDYHFPGNHPQ